MNRINHFPKQLLLTLLTILLHFTHFSILWSNTLPHIIKNENNSIVVSDTLAHHADGDTLNYAKKTADCTGVTIDFTATVTKDFICLPNSGEITVSNITGGTASYEFSLDGIDYSNMNAIETNAGAQTVYVRDANGCVGTKSITVNDASYNLDVQAVTSPPCAGTITLVPQNGKSPYKFNTIGISPLVYSSFNETGAFKNLKIGDYNITVTDGNGCTTTTAQTVTTDKFLPTPVPTITTPDPSNECHKIILLTFGMSTFTGGGVNSFMSGKTTSLAANCKKYRAKWRKKGNNNVVGTTDLITVDGACQVYTTTFDAAVAATYQAEIIEILEDGSEGCSFLTDEYVLDTEKPFTTCKTTNIIVFLDAKGEAKETAATFIQSATDNCSVVFDPIDYTFTCADITTSPSLTITVKDAAGNESNTKCQPVINVIDNIEPIARCKTNITVPLIYDAVNDVISATLTAAQVDDGSTDNCSIRNLSIDTENFGCNDVGIKDVILTVTDASDLTKTCIAQIEVVDNIVPEAKCKPIADFNLDVTNPMPAIISESVVNNNSVYNCTTNSLSLDKYEFYCSGPVTMTLSNSLGVAVSTCNSAVNVIISKPTLDFNSILYVCKGETTGEIIINFKDVDPAILSNFSFGISKDGGSTFQPYQVGDNVFTGLPAGTYYVKIKTSDACESPISDPIIIDEYDNPTLTLTTSGFDCNGGMTGEILAEGLGGTGMLTYNLNGGSFEEARRYENLAAGTYTVIVQDELGCIDTKTVTEPTLPSLTITNPTPVCAPISVDLTAAAVTASSSLQGGSLTYWTDAAASVSLSNPSDVSTSGTYYIKVATSVGCMDIKPVSVTINPLPTATISGTTSACKNATAPKITFTGADGTSPYTFTYKIGTGAPTTISTSAGNASVTVDATTSSEGTFEYSLISVQDANCSQIQTGSATITVNSLPSLKITNPTPVCAPNTVDLTATAVTAGSSLQGGNLTYWMDMDATVSLTNPAAVANSGTFYIKVLTSAGCFEIKPVSVTVNPLPSLKITNPTPVCAPNTVDLTATVVTAGSSLQGGNLTYWTDMAATVSLANPAAVANSGTFYIKVLTSEGCFDIKSVSVTVNPLPSLKITNPTPVCAPNTVDLTATAVTAGSSLQGGNLTYWMDMDATVSLANPATVANSGTFYIKVLTSEGCFDIKSISVTVNPLPSLKITNPTPVCAPNTVDLTATAVTAGSSLQGGNLTYWTDMDATVSLTNPAAVANSRTFYIKVLTSAGCFDIKSVSVTVNPLPSLKITNPTPVCAPNTVDLTATAVTAGSSLQGGNLTYWTDMDVTVSLANPAAVANSGTFYIKVLTAAGCFDIKPVSVTVNTLPTTAISVTENSCTANDDKIISGASVQLIASGTGTFNWDNSLGAGDTKTVNPSVSTTYNVTLTDANGCTATASKLISVISAPTTAISATENSCTANDDKIISGASVQLIASGTGTFAWDNLLGAGDTKTVNSSLSTTYNVTLTDANGCTATASKLISVISAPLTTISATENSCTVNDDKIISGASVQLIASGTGTFNWDNSLGAGNTKTVNPSVSTTYNVTLTDANGCTATASKLISVISAPTTAISVTENSCTANDDKIISGATVQLIGSGTGTFNWDNSLGAGNTKTVNPSLSTTYNVTLTDANGCTATASKLISVISAPLTTISATENSCTANDDKIISGASVQLIASGTGTFNWDNSLGAGETKTVNPSVSTTYNVTLTDANGCTATASKLISVISAPTTAISATENSCTANDDKIISGASVQLIVSGTGTFNWDKSLGVGDTKTVNPSVSTTYNVILTDANGCTATASKLIPVISAPTTAISATENSCTLNDDKIISGASVVLNASGTGTFAWGNSLGAGDTKTVSPSVSTTYNVTLTDANGCTATASKAITVINAASTAISATENSCTVNDDKIISGASVQLIASGTGTFAWDNSLGVGDIKTVSPSVSTTYNVTLTDANGCTSTASKLISVISAPSTTISATENSCTANDDKIISGASVQLVASGTGTFNWDNSLGAGDTKTVSPSVSTTYNVTLTDANGCTATASKLISVISAPTTAISATENSCTANDDKIISGASVQLIASGTGTFTWDNSLGMGATKTVNPSVSTTYNVTLTDANGCTATASKLISVISAPDISITDLNSAYCKSVSPITLTGTPANGTFTIDGNAASTFTPAVLSTGPHSVVYSFTDANGCSNSVSKTVTINALPILTISSQQNIDCFNEKGNITLLASEGLGSYQYSIDGTNYQTSGGFTGLELGMKTAHAKDENGCIGSLDFTITNNKSTIISPNAIANVSICKNESFTIAPTALGIPKFNFYDKDPSVSGAILLTSGTSYSFILSQNSTFFITSVSGTCESAPISTTITAYDCTVSSSDPCSCKNNATTLSNGQFNETIEISAPTGQIWSVKSVTGLYSSSSFAPPANPTLVAINTAFTEISPGKYQLKGIHIDALGYNLVATNGKTDLTNFNTCYYPNPTLAVLNPTFCSNDNNVVTLSGSAQLGDNSAAAMGIKSFTIDGNNSPNFTPSVLSLGNHTIAFTFDADDNVPTIAHPGCIQTVTTVINIIDAPHLSATATNPSCLGGNNGSINLTVTGGSATKTYSWAGPNSFTASSEDINGLLAGSYSVTVSNNENNCSEILTIDVPLGVDATPPTAVCQDITVNLNSAGSVSITADQINNNSSDNCSIKSLNIDKTTFNCSNLGVNNVVLTVTDGSNLTANCTAKVTVSDVTPPTAVCQDITVNLNSAGSVSITADQINNNSSDNCSIKSINIDKTTFNCSNLGVNNVVLTVTDGSNLTANCTAKVTVLDITPPTAVCQDVTVNLSTTNPASVSITTDQVNNNSLDNCSIASLNIDKTTFNCSNLGVNNVVLTVTDGSNLTSNCTAKVTVSDVTPPTAVCQDVTVNLNSAGSISITADQINNNSSDNCSIKSLNIDKTTFNCANLGVNNVVLTITDGSNLTANCTAKVTVSDVMPPTAVCQDVTVNLNSAGSVSITADQINNNSTDNCSIKSLNIDKTTFNCSNLGVNNVVLTVTDGSNLTSNCTAKVTVSDMTPPTAVCQDVTVNLNSAGSVSITADQINNGSSDNCSIKSLNIDKTTFNCSNLGVNNVVLTVTDGSNLTSKCTAKVTVLDVTPPTAVCQDITVNLSATNPASVSITTDQVNNNSSDNCSIKSINIDKTTFNCSNLGVNNVVLTVTDGANLAANCTAKVTVLDITPPTAICQDVTVNLSTTNPASVSITADQINNNSSDNCSIASLNIDKTTFNCSNLGVNNVVLTVTDGSNLTANCTAKVTILDVTPPTAVCQDLTVNLSTTNPASISITADQINNGSSDNCSITSLDIDKKTFNCANLGVNNVVLTVMDGSNLTANCNAKVTVLDITPPTAICQDVTVNLNSAGSVSITADQINNNSSDNCLIKSLNIDKTTFNCSNLGVNNVVLTVTDGSNLTANCNAKVTVLDITPPTAVCQDVTVNLNSAGSVSITADQINNNSSDNCLIKSLNIDKTTFNCSNLGVNNVVLTVTDGSNLTANCNAKVTVLDITPPTAVCQDVTVNLNSAGSVSITADQINNNSSDNCLIKSLNIDKTTFNCSNLGVNNVVLTVTDGSNLTANCNAKVTVLDVTPPTAICQDITVNLSATNPASVSITTDQVNNNSSDNCSIKSLNIDKTTFNCSNLGVNNVVLTVTDGSNLTANCTAKVTVKDITVPTITCPTNISVQLPTSECVASVRYNLPTASDNCSVSSITLIDNVDKISGSVFYTGTYFMRFRATDVSGNFSDCQFTIGVSDYPSYGEITCKSSVKVKLGQNCVAGLSAYELLTGSRIGCYDRYNVSIQSPIFNGGNLITADMLGKTLNVKVSDINGNSCISAVTVEDLTAPQLICPNDIAITCGQIDKTGIPSLKITGVPQVFEECSPYIVKFKDEFLNFPCNTSLTSAPQGFPADKFFNFSLAQNISRIIIRNFTVEDTFKNATLCKQIIYVKTSGMDDIILPADKGVGCTEGYYNTNPRDTVINGKVIKGTGYPYFRNGFPLDSAYCNFSSTYTDNKIYFTDNTGYYYIERTWFLRDFCRNINTTFVQKIAVYDAGITIRCKNDLSFSIGTNFSVGIQASQLVASVTTDCTPLSKIKYGIRKVGNGTGFPDISSINFICADTGVQNVEIWAKDLSGNTSLCITQIKILPSPNNCSSIEQMSGIVLTETLKPALANITLSPLNTTKSTINGAYSFSNLTEGSNYKVQANRDDNPSNGVTTFDIALISRHILGITPLNSPYKIIAADVNRDGEVDGSDMLFIRRLILRSITKFPNNTSWRFVPKQFVFTDLNNPFSSDFPENLVYNNLRNSINNADFTAIKVGDVNNSALPIPTATPMSRGLNNNLNINVLDKKLEAGKEYEISLKVQADDKLTACQFALNIDKTKIDILNVNKGEVKSFDESNYAFFNEKGLITTAWASSNAEKWDNYSILKLTLKARKTAYLSEILGLESQNTEGGVAYDSEGNELAIKLNFENKNTINSSFELLQNKPNPFTDETIIPFYLPADEMARLTIYDITGRVISDINRYFTKGYNEVIFKNKAANESGLLFYRLQTASETGVQKMYFIKKP